MTKKNYLSDLLAGQTLQSVWWPAGWAVVFAMCALVAAAAFLGNGIVFYEPLINAYVPPMAAVPNTSGESADAAVGKKFGQMDLAALTLSPDGYELNPGPAAIAAYESPPH